VPVHRAAERDQAVIAAQRAGADLGEGTRLAAATGAWICFGDEPGQILRLSKARTWGRRGCTLVVTVCGKGFGRVSVAVLACYRPGARARLFYRLRVHCDRRGERSSMSEANYAALVTAAHIQLAAPVIFIWVNLNTQISAAMCKWIDTHQGWLPVERLPV
jgi:hypothetical protein